MSAFGKGRLTYYQSVQWQRSASCHSFATYRLGHIGHYDAGNGRLWGRSENKGAILSSGDFLSAKASDLDKITGLVMGADDYMVKPFNPMELVARVQAQLRRSKLIGYSTEKMKSFPEDWF